MLLIAKREKCVKTSVSLPRDVRRRAAAVARTHRRSLSWYVTKLLEEDLEKRERGRERS
jgi:hypothetical protein